jgi:hypothetical protein
MTTPTTRRSIAHVVSSNVHVIRTVRHNNQQSPYPLWPSAYPRQFKREYLSITIRPLWGITIYYALCIHHTIIGGKLSEFVLK